jgi:hypothetical protein
MINTRLIEIEARRRYGELQRDAQRLRLARSVASPRFAAHRRTRSAGAATGVKALVLRVTGGSARFGV